MDQLYATREELQTLSSPTLLSRRPACFACHSRVCLRRRTWLSEAAKQLYGNEPTEHMDLVDRTAAVLRNSHLTSIVFAAFQSQDLSSSAGTGTEGKDDANNSGNGANNSGSKGSPTLQRLDLSALPSSLRSLLDERSLTFLLELWRVLNRDEPQTADALLHPRDDVASPLPLGEFGAAAKAAAGDAAAEGVAYLAAGGGGGDGGACGW